MSALTTPIVLVPGSPEWRVVHQALAQFVENNQQYIDGEDEPGEAAVKDQETAEAVMERFDAVFVALANT